ncbi:MAG TPA: hypothetical protein VHZ09_17545 [Acidobacteriaceae bacterium]|jgi:hypothetical protein|nr:hypothetical protein [Acidobacteriaceae bacterium]
MRSALPLGHKLIALILAAAVAGGLFFELRSRATESANSAALSFDPVAAQQIDAGLLTAAEPAVVLSQSILSDSVVAKLLTQEGLASSASPIDVGQFRARLDLTQPSPGVLWVRYRDTNLALATTATNAVAETLASWSPSGINTAPPAATPPPAPTNHPAATHPAPPPASAKHPAPVRTPPAKKVAAANVPAPSNGLAAALGELEEQLSTAQRRVGGPRSTGYSPTDGEHQRYLEAQFRAAEQKLHDLRTQYATEDPAAARHLATIREALVAGWSQSGQSAGLTDFHTAGTSAAQLSREKTQLADLIGVVAEQRRAIQREEDARSSPIVETPAPTPAPAPNPVSTATPAPAPQPRAVPPPAADTTAQNPPTQSAPASGPAPSIVHPFTGEDNPLRLLHLAGPGGTFLWWPAVVAGFLCGLIYLVAMSARYRSAEEPLDYPEQSSPQTSYRMITPPDPAPGGSRSQTIESPPPGVVASHKRASFKFESDSPTTLTAAHAVPVAAPAEAPVVANVAPEPVVPNPATFEPATFEPVTFEPVAFEPVAFEPAPPIESAPPPVDHSGLIGSELVASHPDEAEPPSPGHENVVEIADPWADNLKKALSQTTLGRILDESGSQDRETRSSRENNGNQRPPRSGRLAG